MVRPQQFILTTDFPTLKNDNFASATILIPSSVNISGNSSATAQTNVTAGSPGAILRGRISSTKNFSNFFVGQSIIFERTGTVLGSPAGYSIHAFMWRPDSLTVRFQVYILNPYGTTLTTEAGAETISLYANTFIPPYA